MIQEGTEQHHARRSTCRLCDSPEIEVVLALEPTPIADAFLPASKLEAQPIFPLDLAFCHKCGHVQLLDAVDPSVLFRNYIYETSTSLGLVEHFRELADELISVANPPQDALVIDIGSNDGSLLRWFKERGYRVLGIDPARDIAQRATEAGIETLPEFFTSELAKEIREKYGPAHIITANNVFAHSDFLGDMADGISHLLADDGIFEFEVNYLVDILENMLFDTVYHEHLCYHSVKPLVSFLKNHGMELIIADRVSSKGGSLQCVAQKAGGHRAIASSVGELLALEEKMGLDDVDTFFEFTKRINDLRDTVVTHLDRLKAEGKKIVGYGASPTVVTLMYHFGLAPYLEYLVDDNEIKHGTCSPGHHIPVYPSDKIYEDNPDYVIVLAWRFARPIIKRHEKFVNDGGKFIIPAPELRII